jgi:hypothetical protein
MAAALSAKISLQAGPVEYLDPDVYHGEVGAFRKFKSFAYQSEWRVLVDPTNEDIFWLHLKDGIEDISVIASTSEINPSFNFSVRPTSSETTK